MTTSRSELRVAVVGAGPAGLAAAVAAADGGATVVLIDAETGPGGQYWRHPAAGDLPSVPHLYHHLRKYRELMRRMQAHRVDGRVTYLPGHHVWSLERNDAGVVLYAVDRRGRAPVARELHADRLVLAPGAYDLQVPFPGWDLPGVLTAGGAQSLLKGHGVVAGTRVLVAGTGPFLLPVALGLADSGATVLGVHEAGSPRGWARSGAAIARNPGKLAEGAGYAARLARHRVAYRTRSMVLRAHGSTTLEAVTVAPVDRDGRPDRARAARIEVDTLAVGWGFVAQLELPLALGCATTIALDGAVSVLVDDEQRTDVPGVLVAGEACGIGGAELAVLEGEVAGAAAAGGTGVPAPLRRRRKRLRDFASALQRAHPVPASWIDAVDADTVVCRCEEVSAGALRAVVDRDGVGDARTAKLLVRPGMGWCQGRMCGYATTCLTAAWAGREPVWQPAERPIAVPVQLGLLVDRHEQTLARGRRAPGLVPEPTDGAAATRP